MIKSEVEEVESIIEFPKLMIDKNDLIVLFSSPKLGVVVKGDNLLWKVGEHGEAWVMDRFTDFRGSVTLSNGSK